MHSSFVLTPLLASMAVANPLFKRYLTTHIEYVTVWTTITLDGMAPTSSADGYEPSYGYDYGYDSASMISEPTMMPESSMTSEAPMMPESSVMSEASMVPESSMMSEASMVPESSVTAEASMVPESSMTSEAPMFFEPSSSSATPAASPSSVSNAPSAGGSNNDAIVAQHNIHRANHTDTGPLVWSDKLAGTANKISKSCTFLKHDTSVDRDMYDGGYGQNYHANTAAPSSENLRSMITDGFYNSEAPYYEGLYGQNNVEWDPTKTGNKWGHFTQVVWRKTQEVGCYTHDCGEGGLPVGNRQAYRYFTVCNYFPAGNMGGEYLNVGERLGKPTVQVNPGRK